MTEGKGKFSREIPRSLFWHELIQASSLILIGIKALLAIIWRRITMKEERWETEPEFCLKMGNAMEKGFLSLQLSLGSTLGLFDALAELDERAVTSQELADKLQFKERYVREWLDCMVVSRIVETDDANSVYFLPAHRARTLSSQGRPYLMKLMGMEMDVNVFEAFLHMHSNLCNVFQDISQCFPLHGPQGVSYDEFPSLDEWMGRISESSYKYFFIPRFVPSLPHSLQRRLKDGMEQLDVACGIGVPGRLLATNYPDSKFYGIDISPWAIEEAETLSLNSGLTNITFQEEDAASLPEEWTEKFDWVTAFNSIHDQAHPQKVLEECRRVLKPGGYLSVVDFNCHSNAKYNRLLPNAPTLYTVSLFHCMTVSLSEEGGRGLGTMWGVELAEHMLRKAGFHQISFHPIPNTFNCHMLAQKP